jgi:putative DNA primase/helicase
LRPHCRASSGDPKTWSAFAEARAAFERGGFDGIGFVLTESDFAAFDLDDCCEVERDDEITPWAKELVAEAKSYAEVTPSGTGLRIIGKANGNAIHRKFKIGTGSLEIYRRATRYICVTGLGSGDIANIDGVMDKTLARLDRTKKNGDARPSRTGVREPSKIDVSGELYALIRDGAPEGERSDKFFYVIARLKEQGRSIDEIEAILAECPHGIAAKYAGRLRPEIERCFDKVRHGSLAGGQILRTDLGNARRLVRLHGDDIRYVHAWGKWLIWENNHWRIDDDGAVERLAKAAVEAIFDEARGAADDNDRTALRKHAIECQKAARLHAMTDLARSEPGVPIAPQALDADPSLLGVQNGVIDLRTGEFREARRGDVIIKRTSVAYDTDAKCSEWLTFLDRIMSGDRELIAYLQRMAGYVPTGETSEEVLFVLWGAGANGKSTFREALFALLGDYAAASDAGLLLAAKNVGGATPDVARLHGRRLVTINETAQGDRLAEARVKFITGRDKITARSLYAEPFDFTPTHKTMLTTNHKPVIVGTDEGIWRRVHLLPFAITIPKGERDRAFLGRRLIPELPGILNWALEGLKEWRRTGLAPPEAVLAATHEYREDMDVIGQWIEANCIRDPRAVTARAELHRDYRLWAVDEIGSALSAQKFYQDLDSRGLRQKETGGERRICGLRLKKQDIFLARIRSA